MNNESGTSVTGWIVSAWAVLGITTWADASYAIVVGYTATLWGYWWWKNFWRPFLERKKVIRRKHRRETDFAELDE